MEQKYKRIRYISSFDEKFDSFHYQNKHLSDDVKLSIQKICSSVVSIGSFTKKFKFFGTGTIIGCDKVNGTSYISSVLTSTSLFRAYNKNYNVASNDEFKVKVYYDERTFQVREFNYDVHYNIALLKFESTTPMLIASFKNVEVISEAARERLLHPHLEVCHISVNDQLIVVGRYFDKPLVLMVAPGAFTHGCCSLDCPPLLNTTCKISKCGTGGPLINGDGEIIGINFFQNKIDSSPLCCSPNPLMSEKIILLSFPTYHNITYIFFIMKVNLSLAMKVINQGRKFKIIGKFCRTLHRWDHWPLFSRRLVL
ncbi:hypothetical protein MKX03_013781 [Papaver bracteatum]|nr:hypothetical protein MKX03_013781 [Papaver bracteatum]